MIYIIYCLHGDELITEEIAMNLKSKDEITVLPGNPLAHKKRVRYIDTDLNRSFNKNTGYEARRAKEIKKYFKSRKYDLIIDLHSTRAIMPPVAIITDKAQLEYVSKLGLKKVIYMNKEFSTGGALIENINKSISVEINFKGCDTGFVQTLISEYDNDKIKCSEIEVYKVVEIVKKDNCEIKNFKELEDGTFPVFYGETSYKGVEYLKTVRKIIKL